LKVIVFILFRIPHMPPAGSLKVLRAPARQGGIWLASQTKIYNLETNKFVSNPPFSKNWFGGSNIAPYFQRERWIKKKKPGTFKIVLNSGTPARKPGTVSNNLVPEPNIKVWYPPRKHIAIALRCKTFIGH
jgi:hypothetical protein